MTILILFASTENNHAPTLLFFFFPFYIFSNFPHFFLNYSPLFVKFLPSFISFFLTIFFIFFTLLNLFLTPHRPELCRSSVEFIAPGDYMVRPPQPPVYFFVIDVSAASAQSGTILMWKYYLVRHYSHCSVNMFFTFCLILFRSKIGLKSWFIELN